MINKSRREQIHAMLADSPDDPFLRYALAMDHAGAGELEVAATCFRELLDARPDYVPAYFQAARTLLELGRDDEARAVASAGVSAARGAGDEHTAGELEVLLESLT